VSLTFGSLGLIGGGRLTKKPRRDDRCAKYQKGADT